MLKEFRKFAFKGNMVDLAVAVIIGGAFGKIVSSIVSDIAMPLLSLLTGRINFTDMFISLDGNTYATLADAQAAGAATVNYGSFITAFIDFLCIAIVAFIIVKSFNTLRDRHAAPPAEPPRTCPYCKMEIANDATRCPHCTSELPANSASIH